MKEVQVFIADLFYSLAYIFTLPPFLFYSIGNCIMRVKEEEEDKEVNYD
jgi:hypothetical protein